MRSASNWLQLSFATSIAGLLAWHSPAQEKSVKPGINDQFRKPEVAKFVERFEGESREVFDKRAEVLKALDLKPGMAVADVGAGTGLYTRLIAKAVGQQGKVLAVDIAQEFLDHIGKTAAEQKIGNIQVILGKDASTGLPPASVDLVFICDTYHHFEFPSRILESIHQALKPGGRLVIVDFIREPGVSREWILGHVRASQAVVELEVTQAGFRKNSEIKDIMKENYLVTFTKMVDARKPEGSR